MVRKKKDNEWNLVDFYKRVRAGYLEMVNSAGQAWESVQAELRRVVLEKLGK